MNWQLSLAAFWYVKRAIGGGKRHLGSFMTKVLSTVE